MATVDSSCPYNVDYSTSDVVHAWRTQRLEFIRVDPSDQDARQLVAEMENDPVVLSLASSRVLRPHGKADIDDSMDQFSKAMLGVAICLRADEGETEPRNVAAAAAATSPSPSSSSSERKPRRVIGTMCLGWGGLSPRTAHHRSAHMGITLARPYQNRGYGREAINWMLDWAFGHAGLHTVCMIAASYNQRGIHLYQDIGFRLEGRRREVIYFNRGWYDELDFGMTEHEWEKLRGISSS